MMRCLRCARTNMQALPELVRCRDCGREWSWDGLLPRFPSWLEWYDFKCQAILSENDPKGPA
jgi:hypothetical protein